MTSGHLGAKNSKFSTMEVKRLRAVHVEIQTVVRSPNRARRDERVDEL
jgi:hypothetical protein